MKLLLTALVLIVMANSGQAMVIVRNHKPLATIVIDKTASDQVKTAAKTLQNYIQKSTGATLPISNQPGNDIVINVGATSYTTQWKEINSAPFKNLDEEGFILQETDPKNYIITGGSDWGTEFGVYDFLERYVGVRWLMPTEIGEDVPKHATLDIPSTQIRQEPVYLSRQLSPMNNLDANNPTTHWARFNRARGRIAFHHNLVHLFAVSKFGKTHPEFYPIIDGKRYIPKSDSDISWQPNLSAPGIVDAAVEQIEKYFQEHPEATSYSLGMNDSNRWDESDASKMRRSGRKNYLGMNDVSDDYFTWANAVVEKVLLKYPDKWFGTLAYSALAEPPTNVKVNSHIVPFITYDRMRWEDPELRKFGQQLTERWEKVSPTLGWYDYVYGLSYLTPRIYFHRMQKYLRWGAAHNVKFHYAELYPNWGEGPKPWVFTKLLWNPNQNVDDLLNDWYIHFAGSAAALDLQKFYAIWEKFWTVDIYQSKWNRVGGQYLPFNAEPTYLLDVPEAYISQSDHFLEESFRLADTPLRKERVAKIQQMWNIYKSSIITYQDAHSASLADLQTETQALAFLDKVESIANENNERQQLLAACKNDPLFSNSSEGIIRFPATSGKNWGSSLLWRLAPWVQKSSQVKERIQQLAANSTLLQEQAKLILEAANGNVTLVSHNPSFEDGLTHWNFWDKFDESPEYSKGTFNRVTGISKSGEYSLHIQGLGRGAPMQSIPYQAGTYYATANCYVPQDSHAGTATLNLQILNANGVVQGSKFLPSANIALPPGNWSNIVVPFTLPPANAQSVSLKLLITLDGFGPDGQIYLDDVGIYRIGQKESHSK